MSKRSKQPPPPFVQIRVKLWDDIPPLNGQLANYIFRGQAQSGWYLSTTLERIAEMYGNVQWDHYEEKSLIDFMRRAPFYLSKVPMLDKHLE